jgi:energy-converting hydrogenase Eha subunit E
MLDVEVDTVAAVGALLSDPKVQQLLVGLCNLTAALTFVTWAIGFAVISFIIVKGVKYTYRIYREVKGRGEYLKLYSLASLVTRTFSLKEFE